MLGVAIRNWAAYNKSKKLFDACNFKGTFAACKPGACVTCHKDRDDGFRQHPVGNNLSWIRKKLGTLFGIRCPVCFSKNFKVNYLLHAGRNFCQDCGHRWGKVLARRYDP